MDEERFGIRTARADNVGVQSLSEVLESCRHQRVALLIARCPAKDPKAAQAMEEAGFRLMDTLIHYIIELDDIRPPTHDEIGVRPIRAGEEALVEAIARQSFSGFGHYHADSRLDRHQSDEVYASWARRCCAGAAADRTFIAELDGSPSGFGAFRCNADEGEMVLGAVSPWARGHGVYRVITLAGMEWCHRQGARRMHAATTVTNTAAQRAWLRAGMLPDSVSYTFHKWFD